MVCDLLLCLLLLQNNSNGIFLGHVVYPVLHTPMLLYWFSALDRLLLANAISWRIVLSGHSIVQELLWLQILNCHRQQRISWVSQTTKGSSRGEFSIFWHQWPYHQYPVPVAFEVIKRKFTQNINQIRTGHFLENTSFTPKDKVIYPLEPVLNNCVFFFQGKFYQQFQGVAIGYPVSPVTANFYMDIFPISSPWQKRYVDDNISIVTKEQADTFFNHLNSVNPHIKF